MSSSQDKWQEMDKRPKVKRERYVRCRFWDCGWCFAPKSPHEAGCVGHQKCEIPKEDRR